jgi:hypothetical protein
MSTKAFIAKQKNFKSEPSQARDGRLDITQQSQLALKKRTFQPNMVSLLNTLSSLFVCSGRSQGGRALVCSHKFLSSYMTGRADSPVLCRQSVIVDEDRKICEAPVDSDTKTWLVLGDGDLSYSSAIAEDLENSNTRLIATVLEEESVHNQVYERSIQNTESISSHSPHQVKFGIDATKLQTFFPDTKFDCIEFNFPHWRGKTNARYNRQLLGGFLQSASTVLKPDGEIRVALCHGQGGMPVDTIQEWRQSWMAAMYAAEHGLMLRHLKPYEPTYGLSSHRGVDRPFDIGERSQKYTFTFPNDECIDKDLQISCRTELRVMLDPEKLEKSPMSFDDIVHGDAVFKLAQDMIPEGVRFEIPSKHLLTPYELKGTHVPLAIFLVNYSGERMPLTRQAADDIRANIEAAIIDRWQLDIARGGRLVSRPFPYKLLPTVIKKY